MLLVEGAWLLYDGKKYYTAFNDQVYHGIFDSRIAAEFTDKVMPYAGLAKAEPLKLFHWFLQHFQVKAQLAMNQNR